MMSENEKDREDLAAKLAAAWNAKIKMEWFFLLLTLAALLATYLYVRIAG